VHVLADREKMQQVIINLILNAIEASAPDCRILIDLKVEGGVATMSFGDCGPGISNGHLERIFDPFFTTKTQGTGLGLAIVKSIVERHNGSIAVESGSDSGTIFTIKLPIDRED
jgi:signal transduction histidine kinase